MPPCARGVPIRPLSARLYLCRVARQAAQPALLSADRGSLPEFVQPAGTGAGELPVLPGDGIFRTSIGREDPDNLCADLEPAFGR